MLHVVTLLAVLAVAGTAAAQDIPPPAAPPPSWTGSLSAGLAATQGNSDSSTITLAYEVKRDTGSPWRFTSGGLFLRGSSEGQLTTNRLTLNGRQDREFSERSSLFAQVQYLRDSFKEIDYLISPTFGANRWLAKNDRTELAVDAGLGVVWEKNEDQSVNGSGAITATQSLQHKIGETTLLTQKTAALWKMGDLADALYTLAVGLAANVTDTVQMKVELLDTFKNRPPAADVVKNDVAVVVSMVYKFQ